MHSAGLVSLGEKLDTFARTHGVALSAPEARLPGSGFGDAYPDCLAAAERSQGGLPAREVVRRRGVPYRFGLGPEFELTGTADLVVQALPEAGEGAAVIEVHEFSRQAWARASLAGRNLRVLAAFLARPVDPEASGAWRAVDRVVYRHWATGEAMEFRETSVGRLLAVVHAVARGMAGGVVIARALSGYETCRECGHRERCWGKGAGTRSTSSTRRRWRRRRACARRCARSGRRSPATIARRRGRGRRCGPSRPRSQRPART